MMNHLRAFAAALLIATLIPASGAGAQALIDVDPHVEFAPPDLFTAPDGNLWVELTPTEPWEDGAPVDVFSIFFGFDVSNDMSVSGGGWQYHAGEQSVFGTFDGPGGSGEYSPQVLLVEGGQRLRVALHIAPAGPGESPLFFQISAASLATEGGDRIEATPLAGQVGDNLPTLDPLLDATHEFDGLGFSEIVDPITSADQIDPSADTGSDAITGDADPTSAGDVNGVDPGDDVSSEEPESPTPSVAESTPDNAGQSSTSGSGSSNTVAFGAVIALVAAILAWVLLRRRKNQDAELKKMDAMGNEILENIDAPSVDDPPDLPSH